PPFAPPPSPLPLCAAESVVEGCCASGWARPLSLPPSRTSGLISAGRSPSSSVVPAMPLALRSAPAPSKDGGSGGVAVIDRGRCPESPALPPPPLATMPSAGVLLVAAPCGGSPFGPSAGIGPAWELEDPPPPPSTSTHVDAPSPPSPLAPPPAAAAAARLPESFALPPTMLSGLFVLSTAALTAGTSTASFGAAVIPPPLPLLDPCRASAGTPAAAAAA
ncbi:unnamed protein product, partial [Ectocarpus fasciculatus]